ncbi:Nitrogenase subunit NifH, ATPase [Methanonatronarchaeum thermophilum]|uniref:Nitrogenase subunit NifH, ATPase n=1 Tax=Methanonatronarchaeum thermophilum TaxID=1927129 RepID=A0A1Y3GH22_9EURY|nr:P-loop NTPase [Methanonatronarchaeum thermophilum]OUJ19494.1 Nitrogenase subunit NifH, ATPase [Methanonatronarchaeum thermophilum]
MTVKIALYGKGGIGKSTIASNVAAATSKNGYTATIIGCDPKGDSTTSLMGGERIPSVLSYLKKGETIEEEDVVHRGFNGVNCVEVGGPEPGIGCAGRGIIVALDKLSKKSNVVEESDLVIFDVPGDIVCGGLAMPVRKDYVDMAYIVTSGEYLPMYAANNICRGLNVLDGELGGVICNSRLQNEKQEDEIVKEFASQLNAKYIAYVPKRDKVQEYERQGKTIVEADSKHEVAQVYQKISKEIMKTNKPETPTPLTDKELRQLTNNTIKQKQN